MGAAEADERPDDERPGEDAGDAAEEAAADLGRPLRRGWTTGACATAAAKAAYTALLTGAFPDPVMVTLPAGLTPAFALATTRLEDGAAMAAVVKDAGDDPDATHGALIVATVSPGAPGTGVVFRAGPGVGTVTLPGLPLPPGEPAINPVPRQMIAAAIAEVAAAHGGAGDVVVEISVPDGERIAERTWNPRLGILGGISILGTTGIVVPYSCAAWIHAIHRGVDVARAAHLGHLAGATGSTSEAAVRALHGLPELALIDMGDFVGGMLKYLRTHPVGRVTVAGGVAKMSKLAMGMLDLHSKRGTVDFGFLASTAEACGVRPERVTAIRSANTALEAFSLAGEDAVALGDRVAKLARATAAEVVRGAGIDVEVVVFDRGGKLVGRAPFEGRHLG